jgi:hypothetical protein
MSTCLLILVMGTLVMVRSLPILVRLLSLSLFLLTRSTPSPPSTCPLETESTDIESWGLHSRPPPSLIVCVTGAQTPSSPMPLPLRPRFARPSLISSRNLLPQHPPLYPILPRGRLRRTRSNHANSRDPPGCRRTSRHG